MNWFNKMAYQQNERRKNPTPNPLLFPQPKQSPEEPTTNLPEQRFTPNSSILPLTELVKKYPALSHLIHLLKDKQSAQGENAELYKNEAKRAITNYLKKINVDPNSIPELQKLLN